METALEVTVPPIARAARSVGKRAMDICLAGLALIVLSPFFLIVILVIRLGSPGAAIFRQQRTGLGGVPFTIYKFRTMRASAHNRAAQPGDARITAFGRMLRRSSLDELPQLLNIVQGTMSLVGPRPHAIDHEPFYFRMVPGYAERFRVRPGLSGFAQVKGFRGGSELEEISRRVELDNQYIDEWTLAGDLKIIFLTIPQMLLYKAI